MFIEAVASDMFGAGDRGMINPPNPSRYYSIATAELAVFDRDVYALLMDLTVIYDIAKVAIAQSVRVNKNCSCYCILYMFFPCGCCLSQTTKS